MGSLHTTVQYCCVSKGDRVVYSYNGGNPEIDNLAVLCLERTPSYHRWYFQTMAKKTFGFFMEDGYVYFAIADEGLTKIGVLKFLQHLRDEFKKATKKGSTRNLSNLNSTCLQDQLVPVIRHLIAVLENVSRTGAAEQQLGETPPYHAAELTPSPSNHGPGTSEAGASTKAPLLGKSSKQEKKKMKEHVIGIRDIELEEHRKSTERGARVDLGALDANNQGTSVSPVSLQKDFGSMRFRSNSLNFRKRWCRQVRIVLAIDIVVCLVLFGIWLVICGGVECIH
ncbi:phytolongin Phyl1.1-like [Coffea eugenioides]|uniref:phytolongin Phyl1.1-like n=1 Tax=Coffea eugenioides TaxID=49369 RepID=UPI000F60AC24|nr:phytolongin Phyl1.1-like [Coffea eugenioides]XP_027148724.1 phytolongin Phyl1.1-like [Coffea eugenioides]